MSESKNQFSIMAKKMITKYSVIDKFSLLHVLVLLCLPFGVNSWGFLDKD